MKTTADLIGALVKLTSCVEHSHNDLKSRLVQLLVLIYRNTTSVVLYSDRLVFINGDLDMSAIACHCLVDRVIDSLVDQVVQTFFADVTNIHGRTLAHGLQSLEHLNVTRGIVTFFVYVFCHNCI